MRAPRGDGLGGSIARAGGLRQHDAGGVRAGFKRLLNGIFDGDALRVSQAARERLGFLGQIDHSDKSNTE